MKNPSDPICAICGNPGNNTIGYVSWGPIIPGGKRVPAHKICRMTSLKPLTARRRPS